MSISLQTLNNTGETLNNTAIDLNGGATVIQAQSGERFQLTDNATGFAPENIQVQRVGNDLHVAFEGQDPSQPGLIIQDYYTTAGNGNGTSNLLIGLHENGHIYPYVPETAETAEAIHKLAEGVISTQAIGGSIEAIAAFTPFPLWPLALLPLAGLAFVAGGKDKDDSPALPVASLTGVEKVNEGVGTVEYTVTLDKPATEDTTLKYTITHGNTDDADFDGPLTGEITIPKGSTTATIPVKIANDNPPVYEGEETYTITITDPTNATIGKDSVTTTIVDNGEGEIDGRDPKNPSNHSDPSNPDSPMNPPLEPLPEADNDRPKVSINGKENVNEGEGTVEYTISLDKASTKDTIITYTVSNDTTQNEDFGSRGVRTETITIPAGKTEAKIHVDIDNDNHEDGGEKYKITIDSVENADLGNSSTTTTIWDNGTTDGTTPGINPPADPNNPNTTPHDTNDDRGFTLSITGGGTYNEAVGEVEYTIHLNKVNNDEDTTVDVIFNHGTTNPDDFTAKYLDGQKIATVTIPKGEKTATVKIAIANDNVFEQSENYTLTLKNPSSNAQIDAQKDRVTTTIVDDGSSTTDGRDPKNPSNTTNPDVPGSPMTPPTNPLPELDNDRPTATLTGPTKVNEAVGTVEYTVHLDKTATTDITVIVQLAHNNTDDADFTDGAAVRNEVAVVIKAGKQHGTAKFAINDDNKYEGEESYTVSIVEKPDSIAKKHSDPAQTSVTTTIFDNGTETTDGRDPHNPDNHTDPKDPNSPLKPAKDPLPKQDNDLRLATLTGPTEVNEAVGTVEYTVHLDNPAKEDTYVTVQLTHGTTDNNDFSAGAEVTKEVQVLIEKGKQHGTANFDIKDDTTYEGKETYKVSITKDSPLFKRDPDPTKTTVETAIFDDGTGTTDGRDPQNPTNPTSPPPSPTDDRPTVKITGPKNVNEAVKSVQYTLTLDKDPDKETTVYVQLKRTGEGKGHANEEDFEADYYSQPIAVTFEAGGDKSKPVSILIKNDDHYEGAESYEIEIVSVKDDYAHISSTENKIKTTIHDDGTGTTDGSDPKNPTPPSPLPPSDDDRSKPNLTDQEVSITEGESRDDKFIIQFKNKDGSIDTDARLQELTLTNNKTGMSKTIGINSLINASGEFPIEVSFDNGSDPSILKITGYNPATGAVSFTYSSGAQLHKTDGEKETATISMKATATRNGELLYSEATSITGSLTLTVKDTEPKANDDSASLDLNSGETKIENKNVITDTGSGKDEIKADETNVVGVAAGNASGQNLSTGVGTEIHGTYGKLTLKADGSYTYDTAGNAEAAKLTKKDTKTDTFTYTIEDADGDKSDATLTIEVKGKNHAPDAYTKQPTEHIENNTLAQKIEIIARDYDGDDLTYAIKGITFPTALPTGFTQSGNTITYTANNDSATFTFNRISNTEWEITNNKIENVQGRISIDANGVIKIEENATGNSEKSSVFDSLPKDVKLPFNITYTVSDNDAPPVEKTHSVNIIGIDDKMTFTPNTLRVSLDDEYETNPSDQDIKDLDIGERELALASTPDKAIKAGDKFETRYGVFEITQFKFEPDRNTYVYKTKYTASKDNIAVMLLNKNTKLVLNDYLPLVSLYGEKLSASSRMVDATIENKTGSSSVNIKDTAATGNDNKDAYVIDGNLTDTLDSRGGSDAIYIKGDVNANVQMGAGDDYFYAKGKVNSSIFGGDGKDTFTLFDANNQGTIDGGAGEEDTLILAADNTIGAGGLSIKGIEILDTRSGTGSDNSTSKDNNITITEDALISNGVYELKIFGATGDTINLDVADPAQVSIEGNVYKFSNNGNTYKITDELDIGINII